MGRAGQFLQIDIGFGDAIIPSPKKVQFPSILDMPSANLRSYVSIIGIIHPGVRDLPDSLIVLLSYTIYRHRTDLQGNALAVRIR
jgi:hypothetical protein